MGRLGGAGLAAAAGRARTLGMEGERRASQARAAGLPAGGAGGESPGDAEPVPGSSGSSSLLQAEVLDLDEDEDDLEVFSKVRAAAARPRKVPRQLPELARLCGGPRSGAREARSWRWGSGGFCAAAPAPPGRPPRPRCVRQGPDRCRPV